MYAVNINETNFSDEVIRSDRPVLLDFWAPWCGPCRMVGPIVEEIAQERTDIKVAKVNVDEEPELARRFGVMSIPTVVFLKEGREFDRKVGAFPVSRGNNDINAVKQSIQALKEGDNLLIFSEGTTIHDGVGYTDGLPAHAKAGVAMIGVRTGATLVPVFVDGNFAF